MISLLERPPAGVFFALAIDQRLGLGRLFGVIRRKISDAPVPAEGMHLIDYACGGSHEVARYKKGKQP